MFIKHLKKVYIKNNLFSKLNVGDVVWAKRYKNKKQMLKIKKGHREGPYVIIYKKRNKLYCLPCTSNNNTKIIYLSHHIGKLKKETFVRTNYYEIIKPNRYLKFITKTDELNTINKKMQLVKSTTKSNNLKNKFIKFTIDIGDIVLYGEQLYYINSTDDNYYYADPISITKKNKIEINGINYAFNFDALKKIKRNSKLQLVDICNQTEIENIAYLTEQYFIDKKEKNIIKRGRLIKILNDFYYIFGEFENNWLVYQASNKKETKKDIRVTIGKSPYYLNLNAKTISKLNNYEILKIASEEEMNRIKELNKMRKRLNRKKSGCFMKEVQSKSIIRNYETLDTYYVIKRNNNHIYCISSDDINKRYNFELNNETPFYSMGKLDDLMYKNLKLQLSKS